MSDGISFPLSDTLTRIGNVSDTLLQGEATVRKTANGIPSDRKVTIRLDPLEANVYWAIRWAVNAHTWSDLIRGALERLRMEAELGYVVPLTRQALYDIAEQKLPAIEFAEIPADLVAESIDVVAEPAQSVAEPVAELPTTSGKQRSDRKRKDRPRKRPAKKPALPTLPTFNPKAPANGQAKRPSRKGKKNG